MSLKEGNKFEICKITPWSSSRQFVLQHYYINFRYPILKKYSAGRKKCFSGPDLARGQYFAHPCRRVLTNKSNQILINFIVVQALISAKDRLNVACVNLTIFFELHAANAIKGFNLRISKRVRINRAP